MLIEISCEKFRKKKITFKENLNVILGDDNATNSVGKSTLLMLIDFAFGGSSLLKHNGDIITELGHHEYNFVFLFDDGKHYFKRTTSSPKLVYYCDNKFNAENTEKLETFTALLKSKYILSLSDTSFRSFVGVFSRIWGKDNYDVKKPLHSFSSQNAADSINNVIKFYNMYDDIRILVDEEKGKKAQRASMNRLSGTSSIPKVTKTKYKENVKIIDELQNEVKDIKSNLAKYAMNLHEIANREIMDLKEQKDKLLEQELILKDKVNRLNHNISSSKYASIKNINSIYDFFPEIDVKKISEIEQFHSNISKALISEIKKSKRKLEENLINTRSRIQAIDDKLSIKFNTIDSPSQLIDRVYNVASQLSQCTRENSVYKDKESLSARLKELKGMILEKKSNHLGIIELGINKMVGKITKCVYGDNRRPPNLSFSENNYQYSIYDNSGTGAAYYSLLIFDLAIFKLTLLPIIIHDSFLFKNIENSAVAELIKVYLSCTKQSFIAIDEIKKYGEKTEKLLRDNSRLQLDNDALLYIKDWRKINERENK